MARADKWIKIPKEAKVFPDYGKGKCKFCGKELSKGQRFYCCNWHGGRYRYESQDWELVNWADIRVMVLDRDDNKCQVCNEPATVVHHKIPVSKGGPEYDQDNCISLCDGCHKNKHISRRLEPRADTPTLETYTF